MRTAIECLGLYLGCCLATSFPGILLYRLETGRWAWRLWLAWPLFGPRVIWRAIRRP